MHDLDFRKAYAIIVSKLMYLFACVRSTRAHVLEAHWRGGTRRALALTLALAVVTSPLLGAVAVVQPASAGPTGVVTVPDSNVDDIRPEGITAVVGESELEGAVAVSKHADTTEVDIVTTGQADLVANGQSPANVAAVTCVAGNGDRSGIDCGNPFALVITDDVHDEGRKVAIETDALRDSLGRIPEMLVVRNNETGERWETPTRVEDGWLVADVEHFSSNAVTWSGEVNISATPASDGTALAYDINDLDSASDPQINLTGTISTAWDNVTASAVSSGHSQSISVDGNAQPTDGQGGDPKLSVTGVDDTYTGNPMLDQGDGGGDISWSVIGDNDANQVENGEMKFEASKSGPLTKVDLDVDFKSGNDFLSQPVDIYINTNGIDMSYGDGTKIGEWNPDWAVTEQTVTFSNPPELTKGTQYVLEFVYSGSSDGDGEFDSIKVDADGSAGTPWVAEGIYDRYRYADATYHIQKEVTSLSATDGDGNSASFGDINASETVTKRIDLSLSSSSLNLDWTGDGTVDYKLSMAERTETVDPAVNVNNNWVNHTGRISEGSTVTLGGNESWLKSGTNRINVSVAPSLSDAAPTPKVGLNYKHSSSDQQTVTYGAYHWTDSYAIEKNYSSDREKASLKIPFESNIVAIRSLKIGFNNSSPSAVDSADYSLEGNDLSVDVSGAYGGELPAGTSVEVNATGQKIDPINTSITVTDATNLGEPLDTKFQVDSVGVDPRINIGPTQNGGRLHYLYDESWVGEEYVVIDGTGDQHLHLPGVEAGDSARVSNISTAVSVDTAGGDVRLQIEDSGQSPEIDIDPGPNGVGDSITVTHYDTISGYEYILYSLDREIVVDSDTAQSPVVFEADDSDETLEIQQGGDGGSSSGTGGGGGVVQFVTEPSGISADLTLPLAIGAVFVLLGGLYLLRRRFGSDGGSDADRDESGGGGFGSSIPGVSTLITLSKQFLTGVLRWTRAIVAWFGERPRVAAGALILTTVVLLGTGVVDLPPLPDEIAIMAAIIGIPGAAYWLMKRTGSYSAPVWWGLTGVSALVGLEVLSGNLVESVASSPAFVLMALGGLWLLRRAIKAWQAPNEKNIIKISGEGD